MQPFIPAALDDAGLSLAEFRVFAHVLRRGECFESVPKIAEHCRINRDTAWAALYSMTEKGMLLRIARPGNTTIFKAAPVSCWKTLPSGKEGVAEKRGCPSDSDGRQRKRGGATQRKRGGTKVYPLKDTPSKEAPGALNGADRVSADKELERVEARLAELRNAAARDAFGTVLWTEDERKELKRLKARQAELKAKLGYQV